MVYYHVVVLLVSVIHIEECNAFPFSSARRQSFARIEGIFAADDLTKEWEGEEDITFGFPNPLCSQGALSRRRVVSKMATSVAAPFVTMVSFSKAVSGQAALLTVPEVGDLTFQRALGKGAYKTVSLVSSKSTHQQYAMAVEPIRSKSAAKEALIGIEIAQQLQRRQRQQQPPSLPWHCFERIVDWWFQPTSPLPSNGVSHPGMPVNCDERTQNLPTKFLGRTKWLVSLKPVYDMDLQSFAKTAPLQYTVGEEGRKPTKSNVLAGLRLNDRDATALTLAYQMCLAGAMMHELGLVHRDIKPKNIMLVNGGDPVIIDFGFAQFVSQKPIDRSPHGLDRNMCIQDPGKTKGDPNYMLAQDAARYEGCVEGDAYAMGKTIYEVFFGTSGGESESMADVESESDGSSSSSSSSSSTSSGSPDGRKISSVDRIRKKEDAFRRILWDNNPTRSRFSLSTKGRDALMIVVRGLCQEKKPVKFNQAAAMLADHLPAQKMPLLPGYLLNSSHEIIPPNL